MLLLKHLKFIGERSLDSSLHGGDGFTRDTNHVVVKDLPLLRSTFVEHNLLIVDLLSTDNIFNPVLQLNKDLLHARVTLHSSGSTLSPVELNLVVSGLKVALVTRPHFHIMLSHSGSSFERISQFL